jgi:hypothetical protein
MGGGGAGEALLGSARAWQGRWRLPDPCLGKEKPSEHLPDASASYQAGNAGFQPTMAEPRQNPGKGATASIRGATARDRAAMHPLHLSASAAPSPETALPKAWPTACRKAAISTHFCLRNLTSSLSNFIGMKCESLEETVLTKNHHLTHQQLCDHPLFKSPKIDLITIHSPNQYNGHNFPKNGLIT